MYFYGAKIAGFPQLIPTDFRLFWYIFSSGAKKGLSGLVHINIIIYKKKKGKKKAFGTCTH